MNSLPSIEELQRAETIEMIAGVMTECEPLVIEVAAAIAAIADKHNLQPREFIVTVGRAAGVLIAGSTNGGEHTNAGLELLMLCANVEVAAIKADPALAAQLAELSKQFSH